MKSSVNCVTAGLRGEGVSVNINKLSQARDCLRLSLTCYETMLYVSKRQQKHFCGLIEFALNFCGIFAQFVIAMSDTLRANL